MYAKQEHNRARQNNDMKSYLEFSLGKFNVWHIILIMIVFIYSLLRGFGTTGNFKK
jgi:hypothetical protein